MTEIELTGIIGADAARSLVDRFGGGDLNIPKSVDSPLARDIAKAIGLGATRSLVQWARGCRIYLHRNAERERQIRAHEIRSMLDSGLTVAQVAQRFSYRARLSERQIYQILRGA